uniref:HDC12870 n=1 Tax=Drosophila melanogaster TaxID=7227 RepID=Q6IKC8_DROME|nr:TPA_inf: HDC12870 [Drosophila melanogaster]
MMMMMMMMRPESEPKVVNMVVVAVCASALSNVNASLRALVSGKRQAASGKMRYRENAARGKCMVIIVMMTPTSDWRRGRFAFIKINCSQT